MDCKIKNDCSHRKVETCDERDRSILSGTTKVVYSWSNSDPNPTPLKHVTKGFQNVNLIGAKTDFSPSVTSNTTVVEFTMGNISIPNEASVYWCRTIRYTQPAQKNHVIKIGKFDCTIECIWYPILS